LAGLISQHLPSAYPTLRGLVEILPAKGAIMRKFSARDLAQILQVASAAPRFGERSFR
jgi:hypothetical protein